MAGVRPRCGLGAPRFLLPQRRGAALPRTLVGAISASASSRPHRSASASSRPHPLAAPARPVHNGDGVCAPRDQWTRRAALAPGNGQLGVRYRALPGRIGVCHGRCKHLALVERSLETVTEDSAHLAHGVLVVGRLVRRITRSRARQEAYDHGGERCSCRHDNASRSPHHVSQQDRIFVQPRCASTWHECARADWGHGRPARRRPRTVAR